MPLASFKENRNGFTTCWGRGVIPTAFIVLGAMLVGVGCTRERPANAETPDAKSAINVAVSKVSRADLSQDLRIAAEFKPFQEIDVHAKVAGYVKHIYVDVGDRVRKGQTLAILEAPELEHSLSQAEASSRQSTQEVERAQYELKRAEADHAVAHLSYLRLESVSKARPELVAQQEVDDAEGKDRATEAQVAAARSGLAATTERVSEARANRERVRALLDYARITAPFDGVVTARYADTGAMLAAGTTSEQQALPLVKLSQNGLLRLQIPIPETDVPAVQIGKKVNVEVQTLHRVFQGIVSRFSDKVDSATRTMMTEVDVPNSRLEIVPGMYAYVAFSAQERPNALAANIQAVSRQGNKAVAYLVNRSDRIEIRSVTTGLETRNQIEILSGLADGDRVVVGNTSQLRDGQPVVPKLVDWPEVEGGG